MKRVLLVVIIVFLRVGMAQAQIPTQSVQQKLGYPSAARLLVIHADDLGGAHTINRAIFEALEKGWVTSASVLVPCPWFPEVARWAKQHPAADLGIHLALNSQWTDYRWGPVSAADQVPSLLDEQGYLPLLETTPAQKAKPAEVERELRAQVERARAFAHPDAHCARREHAAGNHAAAGRNVGQRCFPDAAGSSHRPVAGCLQKNAG